MSHREDCPSREEAERQGARAQEWGRSRSSNPHESIWGREEGCEEAAAAWRTGYRRAEMREEEQHEEEAARHRAEMRRAELEAEELLFSDGYPAEEWPSEEWPPEPLPQEPLSTEAAADPKTPGSPTGSPEAETDGTR